MAIGFDVNNDGTSASGVLSISYSHTCTGSNRLLVVSVYDQSTAPVDSVTGVTYNGVSLTQAGKIAISNDVNTYEYLYYLINPASGANTVQVTRSSTSNALVGRSTSYTGVLAYDAAATKNEATTQTSVSTSITTVANNCWVVASVRNACGDITAGSNTTERTVASSSAAWLGDTNAAVSAGSNSINVTGTSCNAWGIVLASFSPYVAVPPFSKNTFTRQAVKRAAYY